MIENHANIEPEGSNLQKTLKVAVIYGVPALLLTAGIAATSYATGWGMGVVNLDLSTEPGGEYEGVSCERIQIHAEVPEPLFGTLINSFEALDRNTIMENTGQYDSIFSRSAEEGESNKGDMLYSPLPGIGREMTVEVRAKVKFFGREITIAREIESIESKCTPIP